jgi:hypothetical protein
LLIEVINSLNSVAFISFIILVFYFLIFKFYTMSKNAKLTITSVDNFSQQFGNTDYAVFTCQTENQDFITVAVSHNALRSRGINTELLDSLVSSILVAQDDTDVRTGLVTSGQDRVDGIVNGTLLNPNTGKAATLLLFNKANCSIIKSDVYVAEMKDLASATQAKIDLEKTKERKLEQQKRNAERLRAKLTSSAVTKTEEPVAELETNDEEPF